MKTIIANNRIFLFLVPVLLILTRCAREYSFEGQPPATGDTTIVIPVQTVIPSCPLCNSSSGTNPGTWSFQTGNSNLCGEIDTAIVSPARTAFTFFGPSQCSADSGMVVSVYLDEDTLNRDRANLALEKVVFYYYDRIGPSDIFTSRPNSPFTLTINAYSHQTKIATGTFEGNVFKTNGGGTRVQNGRFHVTLL
jgi:hypothetical protein